MITRWRLLSDDAAGAAEGLALDEALMAGYARDEPARPPTLRLYTYRDHCALIGRYQNLAAEVDLDACRRTGTEVSRRPTGGGAIIMGAGQLGVALIDRAPVDKRPREIIEECSAAVSAGLAELGITATFRGKNDLEAGGRKIAGLGLYIDERGGMLFHASVLADLDIEFMLEVLRIPAAKLADKAVAAVGERVTTVTRETGQAHDGSTVREFAALGFAKAFGVELVPGSAEQAELDRAAELARDRYRESSWLSEQGAIPDGSGSALLKTPEGLLRIYLSTHGDLVKSAVVVGDFAILPPAVGRLESQLRWQRLDPAAVGRIVSASGADRALGVAADRLAETVLIAGRQAGKLAAAAPVRSAGSCYFPESK
ncbi:lipoate-protein ligase A [Saccharomonospora amisosensis]|uniref:Lipoate-protein ligase A n=1 Tax=Saccharomonospora amisosensis TaxID=1128677 RepID=A0A7X5URR7_9PSEU|nr:biotin/lipoate A/B protein ligase family protein [Saccharomonospora amisosensis]NIJ13009.1 lipoate-protein ligase A [Saccharomonospora amisosensis]